MAILQHLTLVDNNGVTKYQFDGNVGAFVDSVVGGVPHPYMEITQQLLAASVDQFIWTCSYGVWEVAAAVSVITVSGGTSASVTVVVCPGSVAIASGTAQLSAVLDLEETAPSKKNGALITTPTKIFPGDSVGLDFSGTLTGLVGNITVALKRVA